MFQSRKTPPQIATLVADLAVIARIETTLGTRARRISPTQRPDFSRLARYCPDLRI